MLNHGFLSFARKYKKQLLDTPLDYLKTASKKVVHQAVEFLGNEIADAVTKSNDNKIVKPDGNSRNVEEIITPPKKGEEISNKLRKAFSKWKRFNCIKICNKKVGRSK